MVSGKLPAFNGIPRQGRPSARTTSRLSPVLKTMKTKEPVTPDGRRIWLERQAFSLSRCCPIEQSNPGDCPLCNLRSLGVRERREWIQGLTLEDLEYLVTYHVCCAAEKKRTVNGGQKARPGAARK